MDKVDAAKQDEQQKAKTKEHLVSLCSTAYRKGYPLPTFSEYDEKTEYRERFPSLSAEGDEKHARASKRGRRSDQSDDAAERLIEEEMRRMIIFESRCFPRGADDNDLDLPRLSQDKYFTEFSAEDLADAQKEIAREAARTPKPAHYEEEVARRWEKGFDDLMFVKGPKGKGVWLSLSELTPQEQLDAYKTKHEQLVSRYAAIAQQVKKREEKIALHMNGYQIRCDTLYQKLAAVVTEVRELHLEQECFTELKAQETKAAALRLQAAQRDVEDQRRIETELQQRFKTLLDTKRELQNTLAGLA